MLSTTTTQPSAALKEFAKLVQHHHSVAAQLKKHAKFRPAKEDMLGEFRSKLFDLRGQLKLAGNALRMYCQQFRVTELSESALMLWMWMLEDDLVLATDLLKLGVFHFVLTEVFRKNTSFAKVWPIMGPLLRDLNAFGVMEVLQDQFPQEPIFLQIYNHDLSNPFIAHEEAIKARIYTEANLAYQEALSDADGNTKESAVAKRAVEAARRLYEKGMKAYENAIYQGLKTIKSIENGFELIELCREEFNRFSPGNPYETSTEWNDFLSESLFYEFFNKLREQESFSAQNRIQVSLMVYFTPDMSDTLKSLIRRIAGALPKKGWLAEVLVKIHAARNYPIERPTLVLIRQFARSVSHGSVKDRLQTLLKNLQEDNAYVNGDLRVPAQLTQEQEKILLDCDRDLSLADKHALLRARISDAGINSHASQQEFLHTLDSAKPFEVLTKSDIATLQKSVKTSHFWQARTSNIPFELSVAQRNYLIMVYGEEKLARLSPKVILQTLIKASITEYGFRSDEVKTVYPIIYSKQQADLLLREDASGKFQNVHMNNITKLREKKIPLSDEQEKIVEREFGSLYGRATLEMKYEKLAKMMGECDFLLWQEELYPADISPGQEQVLDAQFEFDLNTQSSHRGSHSKSALEEYKFPEDARVQRVGSLASTDSPGRSSGSSIGGGSEGCAFEPLDYTQTKRHSVVGQSVFAEKLNRTLSQKLLPTDPDGAGANIVIGKAMGK